MDTLKETLKQLADKQYQEIVNIYRHIHKHPELSFEENNTAAYIKSELEERGIKVITLGQHHSFIAIIEGTSEGKTIGIRAELDALSIKEDTGLEYSSAHEGLMHACGHDIHMASLFGVGVILHSIRDKIAGRFLLIFESGEELLPGGALAIINSPEFKELAPDIMLGMHVLPELETGKIGFCSGRYMASGDEIYLTVKGKGGHAALPHTLIDPIVIASNIILNLQAVVSRRAPALIPTVLSFGRVEAMGATNIIPGEVSIAGTFRTMDEDWRAKAHGVIESYAKGLAQSAGGDCLVDIRKGYPSVYNNPELTQKVKQLAVDLIGENNVVDLEPRMTTDDFAFFSQKLPSVFFRLGVGFENETPRQLHSTKFIANEKSLAISSVLISWLAIEISSK
ncbi:MAG: M20 family metallopeptidase [Bacteroidales bacterium]